jgi:Mg-chelatase subunit ChlD
VNEGTAIGLGFSIEIDATSDVAFNADRVEALITVTAYSTGIAARAARTAEVLVMDRSRSMTRQNKIHEARRAACAAIDMLPDGALLGIIGGNIRAERVFPAAGGLVPVDAAARTAAKRSVMSLWPEGGTKIGGWLAAANELFATGPASGVIRHAVLYSDGKNEHETREELDDALRVCADRFICDVRGLGEDWDYAELLHIAETLGGDATPVIDVADLTDDFAGLMRRAGRLVVPRAYLRLSPDSRFRVESIEQTHPVQAELAYSLRRADGTVIDVPLGPWEQETRCYQLRLRFQPDSLSVADDVRATPVELLAETAEGVLERRADAALVVRRHEMGGGGTVRPERLTQVAKVRELTFAIKGCVDAWFEGRGADADDELDRAVELATELGDDVRLRLLNSVSIRRPDGKPRLRPDVGRGDMLRLGMDSTKTGFPPARVVSPPPAGGRTCHECGETTYEADLNFCENCGAPFGGKAAS